jgi:polyhydroxyalkanoate synthesis repressor PhaR
MDMNRKKVVIKKYENRRLYDTTNSRYINLDEVAQLVQEGCGVEVVDAATGDDLTRLVLTQIIAEHAKGPGSTFPIDVLRQMVAASGKVTQESALNYMKAVFDMYQNAYRAVAPSLTPFEVLRTPTPQRPAAEVSPGSSSVAPPHPSRHKEELGKLRERIEQLESLVSRSGSKKASRKRKARARPRS